MIVARLRSLALLAMAGLATSALATDFHIPLNYNWNGVLHAGEGTNPDDPTGFRSMSDRAFYVDVSDTHALGTSPIVGSTGITYNVVTTPGVLDMVHLGNTGTGTSRAWDAAAGGTANRGTMPTWLPATNSHTLPQVTDVTSMNLTIDANSSISVLYNVSNGGGTFQLVLGFTDASTVTLTLSANDWFGATNPPAAAAGVASQTRLGGTTYTGTSNIDLPTIQPWPTQALAASEAVITPQSIAQAGLGNIVGRQLASLTFQNTNQPLRGYAIYAATVVTGLGPPTNDSCATPIDVADGTTACTSVRATGGTPSSCGSIDTADVWYRYHASASGPVEARTCGAPFDTTLAVYSSCAGPAITCNDNGCGLASRLQWNAVAGQNYLIRVAGNGGTTGTFDLTIDPAPAHAHRHRRAPRVQLERHRPPQRDGRPR